MAKDMTEGNVPRLMIAFTIPLVLGNLLQLMYNAADSMIVGRFVSSDALAAVGTANPIMNIAILFISGMCMGASVLMSHEYGERNYAKLERQVSTTFLAGLVFSLAVTIIVLPFIPAILRLIHVPDEILQDSSSYLRIVFIGLVFTFLYNFYANTLRALGDSKTPLLFLAISAAINVGGDLFFVIVLRMGINGCAIATTLSQLLSALFCAVYIHRKIPVLDLGKKWLVFDSGLFQKTVAYSFTSAMQQAVLQIGKVIIQSLVNEMGGVLGISLIAAFNAVNRIDDFAYVPEQNIGHAMTTLVAQNQGAGKKERMQKGLQTGMIIEIAYALILAVVCMLFARPVLSLFVSAADESAAEVIAIGTSYIHMMAFLYVIPGITNGVQGWFRGIGDLKVTLFSTFMNMAGRIACAYILARGLGRMDLGILVFAWANLAGWIVMLACELPLLHRSTREQLS